MIDELDTVRPGTLYAAEEDFSSEELATHRQRRDAQRNVYVEGIPPLSPLPGEFALQRPTSERPTSQLPSSRRGKNSSGVSLGSRASALAAVSGRAIGIIEGTAVRVDSSDPDLARELRGIAEELWASLRAAV